MLKVFWIYVAALCLAAGEQTPSPRTELVIRAVDEAGAPVRLTRADVYFDVWGGADVTHLPHDETSVRVHLDREGACQLEPWTCNWETFSARVILEARGLAPISSDLFDWMNAAGPLSENTSRAVTIRFPGAAALRIRPGSRRDITLTFRRKQPRSIRLVDRSGAPVADAVVKVLQTANRKPQTANDCEPQTANRKLRTTANREPQTANPNCRPQTANCQRSTARAPRRAG
jgi:hypothetical protein